MLSILSEEVRPMHFEISQRICQQCSLMGWVMNTQAAGTSRMLQQDPGPEADLPLYHLKPHNLNILGKCVFSSASSHTGALTLLNMFKNSITELVHFPIRLVC